MEGKARDLVFISYSREDRVWLERLLVLLKPYARQNLKVWADPYLEIAGNGGGSSQLRYRAHASRYCC